MDDRTRAAYFDGIAEMWDGWEDLVMLARRLTTGLEEIGVGMDETVLDLGCGTGNLTLALLERLSPAGRVVAVDFSGNMLAVARRKVSDARVGWHLADAMALPLGEGAVRRIICYSAWPHFDDHHTVSGELFRVLRKGGGLHVWHLSSRAIINRIHAAAGAAVSHDMLQPGEETARLLEGHGFRRVAVIDDESRYLVSAVKPLG